MLKQTVIFTGLGTHQTQTLESGTSACLTRFCKLLQMVASSTKINKCEDFTQHFQRFQLLQYSVRVSPNAVT